MLTVEIKDVHLEQKIIKKAQAIGKTVQELLQGFIEEKIQEDDQPEKLPFEVEKLDYRKYVSIIDEPVDAAVDDTPLFQNGLDTITFAKQLREQAWKRSS